MIELEGFAEELDTKLGDLAFFGGLGKHGRTDRLKKHRNVVTTNA